MRVRTMITGTKPLIMHNIQLANPDNYFARSIKKITAKRKKTDDDRAEIARLEWMGSLYTNPEAGKEIGTTIVMPTTNVLKCFKESAKITKEGKNISRALTPIEIVMPLLFKGPSDPEKLINMPEFRDQSMVGVGTQRVLRTRPIFHNWAVAVDFELLTNVLDYEDFARIVVQAGRVEGLCDNRSNGYGRFNVQIQILQVDGEEDERRAA